MSQAMRRLMTVTASTKRAAMVSGKRSTPIASIASLLCLPIDPLSSAERELLQRMGLGSPIGLFQTVVSGSPDIVSGDILTVGSQDYNIRGVEDWPASSNLGDRYLRLVIEKVKP